MSQDLICNKCESKLFNIWIRKGSSPIRIPKLKVEGQKILKKIQIFKELKYLENGEKYDN